MPFHVAEKTEQISSLKFTQFKIMADMAGNDGGSGGQGGMTSSESLENLFAGGMSGASGNNWGERGLASGLREGEGREGIGSQATEGGVVSGSYASGLGGVESGAGNAENASDRVFFDSLQRLAKEGRLQGILNASGWVNTSESASQVATTKFLDSIGNLVQNLTSSVTKEKEKEGGMSVIDGTARVSGACPPNGWEGREPVTITCFLKFGNLKELTSKFEFQPTPTFAYPTLPLENNNWETTSSKPPGSSSPKELPPYCLNFEDNTRMSMDPLKELAENYLPGRLEKDRASLIGLVTAQSILGFKGFPLELLQMGQPHLFGPFQGTKEDEAAFFQNSSKKELNVYLDIHDQHASLVLIPTEHDHPGSVPDNPDLRPGFRYHIVFGDAEQTRYIVLKEFRKFKYQADRRLLGTIYLKLAIVDLIALISMPEFYAVFVNDCFEYAKTVGRNLFLLHIKEGGDPTGLVKVEEELQQAAAVTGSVEAQTRQRAQSAVFANILYGQMYQMLFTVALVILVQVLLRQSGLDKKIGLA
ncbi:hypothetical protein BT69DRAFT_1298231 [Atractiella rhizophila]|nr:hypothetical protein BT69DRAFT_1298231 [Atractiella rhizophila]